MEIARVERRFKYGSLVLEDPDPNMTPQQVKEFYADVYPELTQAGISGPDFTETNEEYEFRKTVGTKGITVATLARRKAEKPETTSEATVKNRIKDIEFMTDVARAMAREDGEPVMPPSEAQGMV